jgi:hypothetical protein
MGSFFWTGQSSSKFWLLFRTMRYVLGNFDKNGLGCILGDFLNFHIRHPVSDQRGEVAEEGNGDRPSARDRGTFQNVLGTAAAHSPGSRIQRTILNFAPRVKLWTQGWILSPRGEFCPPGVNFVPQGWILFPKEKGIPWGWNSLFAPPFF